MLSVPAALTASLSDKPPVRSRLVPGGAGDDVRLKVTRDLVFPGVFLGSGSFGQVYKHDHRSSGVTCVVKNITRPSGWTREDLVHEAEVMAGLDHPYILRLLAWYELDTQMGMVMDFCAGGELLDAVREGRKKQSMPERWAATVFRQILEAITYCHAKGVVHKDLKTDNILLLSPPPPDTHIFDAPPHAVVADWGLAECVTPGGIFRRRGHEVAGTASTMAPEVWKGNCGPKCDIWSLGCVLFQVMANRLPFEPPKGILDGMAWNRQAGVWAALHRRGPRWSEFHGGEDALDLCKHMLQSKEQKRPDAKKCRDHAWVKLSNWSQVPEREVQAMCQAANTWLERHPLQRAMCLKMAASRATVGKSAVVFSQLDLDHNGMLSSKELLQGLTNAGVERSQAKKVVTALSLDGSGVCSYTEFLAATLPGMVDFDRLVACEFAALDVRGRGGLQTTELENFFKTLTLVVSDRSVQFPDLDTGVAKNGAAAGSGDQGGSGQVDLEKFSAFFSRHVHNALAFPVMTSSGGRNSLTKSKPKSTRPPLRETPMPIVVPVVTTTRFRSLDTNTEKSGGASDESDLDGSWGSDDEDSSSNPWDREKSMGGESSSCWSEETSSSVRGLLSPDGVFLEPTPLGMVPSRSLGGKVQQRPTSNALVPSAKAKAAPAAPGSSTGAARAGAPAPQAAAGARAKRLTPPATGRSPPSPTSGGGGGDVAQRQPNRAATTPAFGSLARDPGTTAMAEPVLGKAECQVSLPGSSQTTTCGSLSRIVSLGEVWEEVACTAPPPPPSPTPPPRPRKQQSNLACPFPLLAQPIEVKPGGGRYIQPRPMVVSL